MLCFSHWFQWNVVGISRFFKNQYDSKQRCLHFFERKVILGRSILWKRKMFFILQRKYYFEINTAWVSFLTLTATGFLRWSPAASSKTLPATWQDPLSARPAGSRGRRRSKQLSSHAVVSVRLAAQPTCRHLQNHLMCNNNKCGFLFLNKMFPLCLLSISFII